MPRGGLRVSVEVPALAMRGYFPLLWNGTDQEWVSWRDDGFRDSIHRSANAAACGTPDLVFKGMRLAAGGDASADGADGAGGHGAVGCRAE